MPIYEYVCGECQACFEHLQRSMSESPKPACPQCQSKKTSRKLSLFAVNADAGRSNSSDENTASCGRCGGMPGSCQM